MQFGKILSVFAKAEADTYIMHCDVKAWNAPSECHNDVDEEAVKYWKQLEQCYGEWDSIINILEKQGINARKYYNYCVERIDYRENPFY